MTFKFEKENKVVAQIQHAQLEKDSSKERQATEKGKTKNEQVYQYIEYLKSHRTAPSAENKMFIKSSADDEMFNKYFRIFHSRSEKQERKETFAMYSVVVDILSLRCANQGWRVHGKSNKLPQIHGRSIAVSGKYKAGKTFVLKKLLRLDVPDYQTTNTGMLFIVSC